MHECSLTEQYCSMYYMIHVNVQEHFLFLLYTGHYKFNFQASGGKNPYFFSFETAKTFERSR